jgi:hypothetical protein
MGRGSSNEVDFGDVERVALDDTATAFHALAAESVMRASPNGTREWRRRSGELHREDGPAVEYEDGTREWWLNGKLHREDGPAVEEADGTRWWYRDSELHREDGPALEWANGRREWWLNGKRHREDGPAIEHPNGQREWWLNGEPSGASAA